MPTKKADELERRHQRGFDFRERGEFEQAHQVLSEVVILALEQEEITVAVGALGDRALVWKHLFMTTKRQDYVQMMLGDALAMLWFSGEYQLPELEAKAWLLAGEAYICRKDYEKAVEHMRQAVERVPEGAIKGDYVYHLGEAVWRAGEKEVGLATIREGIAMLQAYPDEVDRFTHRVWLSGGYLRLAELAYPTDPAAAKQALDEARAIIEADERLVIRKRQLAEVEQGMRLSRPSE